MTVVTSREITWNAGALRLNLAVDDDRPVRLGLGADEHPTPPTVALVELSVDDEGRTGNSHDHHRHYRASARLRYLSHQASGDTLTVLQQDAATGLEVHTRLRHHAGADVISAHSTVRNSGDTAHRLAFVSSLNISGFTRPGSGTADLAVHLPRNSWLTEFRWRSLSTEDLGFVETSLPTGSTSSHTRFPVTSVGSWSTGEHLPMGAITDRSSGRTWAWQIEHNGAWHWELTDLTGDLQASISGPTDAEHQWTTVLEPGDSFTTVPAAIAFSGSGLTGALAELNSYRRSIRRPNADNENLPVIFNDYMNCLNGNPTTEKLLPLIEAAASVGSEYFVIDAGWYSETESWWPTVGEWQPSTRRFPGGLSAVIDKIRYAGMVPGLWVEPEVVGVESPIAEKLPAEAFFTRHGKRLAENGRYQLDYRHPATIEYMDSVIDRLIADFGVGYFKFDYNINIGVGTDIDADSPGAGLLGHNRAYSAWLDGLFARHPDLVIENCSSGGLRVDYAQLRRMSIQSTSDQQDPMHYVPIAAAAPSAVTPEQAAIWAYPQPSYDDELNTLTLINAMLGRVHLSGRIDQMTDSQLALVSEAIDTYKSIRTTIRQARPFWPLGLPGWSDPWIALGLRSDTETLLAVWRRGGPESVTVPLRELARQQVEPVFPLDAEGVEWDTESGQLRLSLPTPSARLFRLRRSA
ncbi:MAG TPA: alpha-galactosidase [Mycobacteriales bacterium]|nr:alpha-galactosidase [Mycobacteriales bacterium]